MQYYTGPYQVARASVHIAIQQTSIMEGQVRGKAYELSIFRYFFQEKKIVMSYVICPFPVLCNIVIGPFVLLLYATACQNHEN